MMIYIDQETGKRVNIHAPYKGRSRLDTPEIRAAVGVVGIENDPPPSDFNYDAYTVREDWETTARPYTIYERKSDEQIAAIRWEKIKQKRDTLTSTGGCKVGDKWYHSDTHSKVQQLALVSAGTNLPAGIQWKTMDGTFVTMTTELAASLFFAQMAQEQAIFAHAESLKADLTADINAGWPETYVEPQP